MKSTTSDQKLWKSWSNAGAKTAISTDAPTYLREKETAKLKDAATYSVLKSVVLIL